MHSAKGIYAKKIQSEHPNDPRWEVAAPEEMSEIRKTLAQSFTYIGSGNHCYAFISEDGKFVLKFFKQKHMRTQSMLDYLPLSTKSLFYPIQRFERRTREREESFGSYKIAYEKLRDETALIYLHLNKTVDMLPNTTLFDQHGTPIQINLDTMEFLLQKKATLAFEHLESLFDQKEALLDAIESLLRLVAVRSQKGIYDKDLQFYKNFGFQDGKAVEIDIGEFKLNYLPSNTFEETYTVSLQIRDFIRKNAPERLPDVQAKIDSTLKDIQ